jgi:hypothetical protein
VVISYEKRGKAENYIKEAKYDMAVGHLLLKSFWAKEAVFQMMMLSYNLFLLFKFDFLCISEFRQQIKTFRLKCFSYRENYQLSKTCGHEAPSKISK